MDNDQSYDGQSAGIDHAAGGGSAGMGAGSSPSTDEMDEAGESPGVMGGDFTDATDDDASAIGGAGDAMTDDEDELEDESEGGPTGGSSSGGSGFASSGS